VTATTSPEVSIALAYLLRGPLHAEDAPAVWESVTTLGPVLRDHLSVLGMRLVVDDVERYAYLRAVEDLPDGMPRLVRRHSLPFGATVLLILLRQQLTTAEIDGATPRLIVTADEMVEMLRLYHRDGIADERIALDISGLEKLGYLRKLRGTTDTYEVRRIIKALVTADWIAEYGQAVLDSAQRTVDSHDAPSPGGELDAAPAEGAGE